MTREPGDRPSIFSTWVETGRGAPGDHRKRLGRFILNRGDNSYGDTSVASPLSHPIFAQHGSLLSKLLLLAANLLVWTWALTAFTGSPELLDIFHRTSVGDNETEPQP